MWLLFICLLYFSSCKGNCIYLHSLCQNSLPPELVCYYLFWMSRVLLWFRQGYTHMVSSDLSASNTYFLLLRVGHTPVFFWQYCVGCTHTWNANVFVSLYGNIKLRLIYFHEHVYDSWTGYNYVPVEFYFCKIYHKGANISSVIYQTDLSVRNTQCVSVFCGLVPDTS